MQLKVFALLASIKETVGAIPNLYFTPTPPRFFHRECSFEKYLPPLTKVLAVPQTYTTAAIQNPINMAGDRLGEVDDDRDEEKRLCKGLNHLVKPCQSEMR